MRYYAVGGPGTPENCWDVDCCAGAKLYVQQYFSPAICLLIVRSFAVTVDTIGTGRSDDGCRSSATHASHLRFAFPICRSAYWQLFSTKG